MNGLLILSAFAIMLFALVTLLRKWADSFVLIAFAIGCAINANIFNSVSSPVEIGGLVFSIDSILFSVFMYVVIVKFIHYPVKDGKTLVYSTVVAIIISAVIELIAHLSAEGYAFETLAKFFYYCMSAFASLISIWVMVLIIKSMEKRKVSRFLTIPTAMVFGSIINTLVYYGSYALFAHTIMDNFSGNLLGSIIGKIVCIIIALLSYLVSTTIWIPNELKRED